MIKNYSHLVSVVEKDGRPVIRIERVFHDRNDRKDFYTEIELPEGTKATQWDIFDKVSVSLGKSLCIDSPKVRTRLGIDEDSDPDLRSPG
jgi:hypothetical protein